MVGGVFLEGWDHLSKSPSKLVLSSYYNVCIKRLVIMDTVYSK